jgi:hypothetical protein
VVVVVAIASVFPIANKLPAAAIILAALLPNLSYAAAISTRFACVLPLACKQLLNNHK